MKSSQLVSMSMMCFANAFVLHIGLVQKLSVSEQILCGVVMLVFALIVHKE